MSMWIKMLFCLQVYRYIDIGTKFSSFVKKMQPAQSLRELYILEENVLVRVQAISMH